MRLARLLSSASSTQQQQQEQQEQPAAAGSPSSPLGVGVLVGVVLPLVQQAIMEGRGGEEGAGGHEVRQGDTDRKANVAGGCL